MDSDDDPLLLQSDWLEEEQEEEEEEEDVNSVPSDPAEVYCDQSSRTCLHRGQDCGLWSAVGWVFTNPWLSSLVLAVGCLLPCALTALMFLYYPPLDIDLSYNAFEVRGHASSEHFDALTLALKSQLASWGRSRQDADDYATQTLQDLLQQHIQRQGQGGAAPEGSVTGATQEHQAAPQKENGAPSWGVPTPQRVKRTSLGDSEAQQKETVTGVQKGSNVTPRGSNQAPQRGNWTRAPQWGSVGKEDGTLVPVDTDATYSKASAGEAQDWGPEFRYKSETRVKEASYNQPSAGERQGGGAARVQVVRAAPPHRDFFSLHPSDTQSHAHWRMELIFMAQGDGDPNIFTAERLRTIHSVERSVMKHPHFREFCWKPHEVLRYLPLGSFAYCSPPSSLLSYLFPTERGGKIYYDGMGQELADIQGTLQLAITHPEFYWYVDEALTAGNMRSSLLRSEILFGAPLPSFLSLTDRGEEQRRLFQSFVISYADMLAQQSTSKVKVLYGGTELFDYEVRRTFHNDMLLAFISGACIVLLVYILTSFSVFLSFFGIASIGLSCLVALFLYHVVFGVRYLGILNGVSAFVIIGIGVDDVFVFINTFRQAVHLRDPRDRMIHTVHTAGKATFFTSFTTAAAYTANTFSQLPGPVCEEEESRAVPVPGSSAADSGEDVLLLSLVLENVPSQLEQHSPGFISSHILGALQRWVARPVIAGRRVIVGVYGAILLVSAGLSTQLCPASRSPLLFSPDTNIQTLLDLKYNLSAEGIPCLMCSGLFQEKPHPLHDNIRTCPSDKRKRNQSRLVPTGVTPDPLLTVYVSKLDANASPSVYRFSLNTSVPLPWKPLTSGKGEVPSFQAYRAPHSDFTKRLTVCVSSVGLPGYSCPHKWMITSGTCDPRHGWRADFSFYVAPMELHDTRKLYFAQMRRNPFHSRVCVAPPGCVVSAGPDGPNQGFFYIPVEREVQKVPRSLTSGFNPCMNNVCGHPAVRPLVDTEAMVFVVFGILGLNRTRRVENHVIGDMGNVIYDESFDLFKEIGSLCKLCKVIGNNAALVKPGGAQCLPSGYSISSFLKQLHPECQGLPEPNLLPGQLSHGAVGLQDGRVRWVSMAFKSTTYKGKSSFQTHSDYLQWESFLQQQLDLLPQISSLQRGFQTCEHWKQIFMEILVSGLTPGCPVSAAVQSALCSLLLSLVICVAAVVFFTAHLLLLLPVLLSILGELCLVVAMMYCAGWEMGAVEAISLSVLVGSSVDYCVHLVEGFLLAEESPPPPHIQDESALRQWRTLAAVNQVGVAIISSAVTTIIATVPLFFCIIAPFAKFGKIMALNTGISVLYTLTVCTALLSTLGPAHFSRTRAAVLKAGSAVLVTAGTGLAVGWTLGKLGVKIPFPTAADG
ncbi:UNVERIFIED_CONTAM: hypothetical protein FKN15_040788 [Acipenser sinensis]